MPIKPCSRGGKKGYKYGSRGKCYVGKGARAKAARQGRAIKSSQARQGKRGRHS